MDGVLVSVVLLLAAPQTTAQVVVNPVAISGTAAPAGGNYGNFQLAQPVLNASGQVAFEANLTGGSSPSGLFAGAPGALQAVALQGSASPAGGTYSLFVGSTVINASGQVGFEVNLSGTTSQLGIFAGAPGSVQTVALKGSPAPAGGNYNTFSYGGQAVLNGPGQVAFFGNLTGGSSSQGMFAGAAGSLQTVALAGTPAPAGGNFNVVDVPVLNASGKVAFYTSLTGGSVNSGLFAGAPGSLQTVAVQGGASPAGGTYSGFSSPPVINAAGQVAFVATMTGGTAGSGVFVGQPGSPQVVAQQGSPAPAGGNYISFDVAQINSAGQVAYLANLTGGSSTQGIFVGVPGSVKTAALQGLLAPSGGGASYSGFVGLVLNASDEVAFVGNLTGTGVTSANNQALYAGPPGGVVEIVRTGDLVNLGGGLGIHTVSAISFQATSGGEDGRGVTLNDFGELVYRLNFTDGMSGIFTSTIGVPEPSSLLLTLAGLLPAVRFRKRAANSAHRLSQRVVFGCSPEEAA